MPIKAIKVIGMVEQDIWRSLKQEKFYRIDLETVREAKQAIKDCMKFYNYQRPHQSLNYKTPGAVHFPLMEHALVGKKYNEKLRVACQISQQVII